MKLRNALLCLDCDEIYMSIEDACPRCLCSKSVKLSRYIPAMQDPINEAKEAKKNGKTIGSLHRIGREEAQCMLQDKGTKRSGAKHLYHAIRAWWQFSS
jgi:hypothetical protein